MYKRRPNIFEKILLLVGVLIVIIGYSFVHRMYLLTGQVLTWDLLQAMFLWLLLAVMLIMLAVTENVKEELRILIEQHLEEIKLLREDIKRKVKRR
jgi:hypothetical protein